MASAAAAAASAGLAPGVADEDAFREECRRRGQSSLPAQPASASVRALRPPRLAAVPRHASPYVCEDQLEQGRQRASTSWDPAMPPAGPKEGGKLRKQKQREETRKRRPARGKR